MRSNAKEFKEETRYVISFILPSCYLLGGFNSLKACSRVLQVITAGGGLCRCICWDRSRTGRSGQVCW